MSKEKDRLEVKLQMLKEIEEDSKFSVETKVYARLIIDRIKNLLKKQDNERINRTS